MGDILISNQCNHWWGGIDHMDGPGYWNLSVATGIGVSVCDLIDSGTCEFTVPLASAVPLPSTESFHRAPASTYSGPASWVTLVSPSRRLEGYHQYPW